MAEKTKSPNLKNGVYVNDPPVLQLCEGLSRVGLVKKFLTTKTVATIPEDAIPVETIDPKDLVAQRDNDEMHIYRLGHSSLLMKFGAEYWLTDPVFCSRVSPSQWVGSKRFHEPPIAVEDLPPITGVIISHNHYDHLDKSAIQTLKDKVGVFIVSLGLGKILVRWGVDASRIVELDWWQSHQHSDMRVTATPTQHFSGRGLHDTNKTLWASYVFEQGDARVFFGSDSGYFDGFEKIGNKFGSFDVAMLETGAYAPTWPHVHMLPEQTIKAHKDLGGKVLMPIHNATFKLSFHPWKEPLERIAELARQEGVSLLTPIIGERVIVGAPVVANPWWSALR